MEIKPVQLTESALAKVREIMKTKGVKDNGYSLRIGVKGGAGCAGVSYMLGFDKAKELDIAYKIEDVEIIVEKKQVMFLAGLEVDWITREEEQGFSFEKKQ